MNTQLNRVFATFVIMLMALLCVSAAISINAGNDKNLEEIEAEIEEDVEENVEVVPATTAHFVLDEMAVIAHHEVHHQTVDEIDEIHEPVLFNEEGEPNCSTTYVVGSDDLSSD